MSLTLQAVDLCNEENDPNLVLFIGSKMVLVGLSFSLSLMNFAISSSPFFSAPIISLAVETGTSMPVDIDSNFVSLSEGMNVSVRTMMTDDTSLSSFWILDGDKSLYLCN